MQCVAKISWGLSFLLLMFPFAQKITAFYIVRWITQLNDKFPRKKICFELRFFHTTKKTLASVCAWLISGWWERVTQMTCGFLSTLGFPPFSVFLKSSIVTFLPLGGHCIFLDFHSMQCCRVTTVAQDYYNRMGCVTQGFLSLGFRFLKSKPGI